MKKDSVSQVARNQMIIKEAMSGISNTDIAEKYNLTPERVSVILNHSPESINMHERVNERFNSLVDDAFDAVIDIVKDKEAMLAPTRLKAAQFIFDRAIGKLTDKLEAKIDGKPQFITPEQVRMAQERLDEIKKKLGME